MFEALVDPLVIDRHVDRYRCGKRHLDALCDTYGVVLGNPHDAGSDVDATVKLAHVIAGRYPEVASYEIGDLTRLQADWHRTWACEYDARRRENGHVEAFASRSSAGPCAESPARATATASVV